MSKLQAIQANVDHRVAELLTEQVSQQEILITFELQLERAKDLLRQVNNACNASHGVRAQLLTIGQAAVLVEAVKYIIQTSNDLVGDLNAINGSGIHEVDAPIRYRLIIDGIIETADRRYASATLWRIMRNRFKKIDFFRNQFDAKPTAPAYDFVGDERNDLIQLQPYAYDAPAGEKETEAAS